jgi:hypothetical protein
VNVLEIVTATRSLAENDQSIPEADIVIWIDQAINRINTALQANIPMIKGLPTSSVPQFDPRFHEALVLFCVGKYRESDSAYNDAQYFMGQFQDMTIQMQRDMVLLPSTQVGYDWLQLVGVTGTYVYNLNIPSGSYYDNIEVFLKDVKLEYYTVNSANQTLSIKATQTITTGDKITVHFENNSDLNNPPYQWWGF